ncbi:MAG: hypothetical protein GY707_07150 [Desulfobacteraceae bacterium]|nr:hypothetical protein [Desulfobacteraceae bacterium]
MYCLLFVIFNSPCFARDFVVKVTNDEDNSFISPHTYKIDVSNIHPISLSSSEKKEQFQAKERGHIESDRGRLK